MGVIADIQPLTSTATESAHMGDLVASVVSGIPSLTAFVPVDRCSVVSVTQERTAVGYPTHPHPAFVYLYISIPLTIGFWGLDNFGIGNFGGDKWVRSGVRNIFTEQ